MQCTCTKNLCLFEHVVMIFALLKFYVGLFFCIFRSHLTLQNFAITNKFTRPSVALIGFIPMLPKLFFLSLRAPATHTSENRNIVVTSPSHQQRLIVRTAPDTPFSVSKQETECIVCKVVNLSVFQIVFQTVLFLHSLCLTLIYPHC